MNTDKATYTSPKVVMPYDCFRKIMDYAKAADTEISGFFDVEYSKEDKTFFITKVYNLLDQEAGGANVELDDDAIDNFLYQLIRDEAVTQLPRGWWHSHVEMQTFMSATDDSTIELLKNESFIVAICVNQKEEMFAVIKQWAPLEIRIDKVEIEVLGLPEYQIPEEIRKEVAEKVKTRTIVVTRSNGSGSFSFDKNKLKPNFLPKDRQAAIERIKTLGLSRAFDRDAPGVLWKSPSGQYWMDKWEVVKDYISDSGAKLRCINCNYTEQFHSDDICPNPEFEPDWMQPGYYE